MRFRSICLGAAALFAVGCADQGVVAPAGDDILIPSPSYAIVDYGNGGTVPGFWFLPPLARQVTTTGDFDGGLQPAMSVCEIDLDYADPDSWGDPLDWAKYGCVATPVVVFAPGDAVVVPDSHYLFSWSPGILDVDLDPQDLDPNKNYRIIITLDDVELGFFDVNPQNPSGQSPGDDVAGLYAFRLGETLPVKVFLSVATRCATAEGYVIQCTASAVIDQTGGVVTLTGNSTTSWSTLSVVVPPSALPDCDPNDPSDPDCRVILTMERIDPVEFAKPVDQGGAGEECIPSFDAPLFADCLRVTTVPELTKQLRAGAEAAVEICFNTGALPPGLDDRLQIVRYDDGVWQGLPNVQATTCGGSSLNSASLAQGLLPVPESGLLRYAALGVNRVARILGPEPLAAHGEIRLAGATSEFSRFRWTLPGGLSAVENDWVIREQQDGKYNIFYLSDPNDPSSEVPVGSGPVADTKVTARVLVQDAPCVDDTTQCDRYDPEPVNAATVHFKPSSDVSPTSVTTIYDPSNPNLLTDGIASTTWTVPSGLGTHDMYAWGRGHVVGAVPDHGGVDLDGDGEPDPADFTTPPELKFTATVVGRPSTTTQSPAASPPLTGLPGETLTTTPLSFTVKDAAGNPVVGWTVTWTTTCSAVDPADCNGSVTGATTTTGTDGSASGIWTLATTPGAQTATATVGGVNYTFTGGTWNANAVCQVTVDGILNADEWACALAREDTLHFVANVSGGNANAEVYWQNYGGNLYFAVKVFQADPNKANSVRLDFDRGPGSTTADNSHDANDDAIGVTINKGDATFYDQYLTAKCANSSQSGCGAMDPGGASGQNGAGDFDPTQPGYITYELVHPLSSGQTEDFSLTKDDLLGFFITLQSGNGAQGNTQFPGFRQFKQITIR
ncbi:MAG TPA: hypothetical protein VLA36_00855 [Longimicrobiales bacterium]|nr:hypothetical protein [Longimicrobiales bacterium]